MHLYWLKCEINKGMFSDERNVTVHTHSGENVAVFVPKQAADEQKGVVRVQAFERQGKTIAVLPDSYHSVVDVRKSDLHPA